MDSNINLLMLEDFLKKDYRLYIHFSKHYQRFITCFAKESSTGLKYRYHTVDLKEMLEEYSYILRFLCRYEKTSYVVFYDKIEDNYQISVVEDQIKGLQSQDEYFQKIEQYSVCDGSLGVAFSRLDENFRDEFEIRKGKSKSRRFTFRKNSDS